MRACMVLLSIVTQEQLARMQNLF
uniref:Uncharacterized protein n=1 Tax=Arundo donax TaxID=35708 RepID=A0A0A9ANE0_ARUDO